MSTPRSIRAAIRAGLHPNGGSRARDGKARSTTGTSYAGGGGRGVSRLVSWRATGRDLAAGVRRPAPVVRKLGMLARDLVHGRLLRVPIDLCIDANAFGYGRHGWHFYTDLARELQERPGLAVEESRFYRLLSRLRAPTFTDILTFHDPRLRAALPTLPYGSYPWGTYEWYRVEDEPADWYDRSVVTPRRIEVYDASPEDDAPLRIHFGKIARLVTSIRRSGYRPLLGGGYLVPTVGVLERNDGTLRLLVKDGNHRVGVLAGLGCERIWVRLDPRRFPPVREREIGHWRWVAGGLLPAETARRMFSLFFELDGSERASALGLTSLAASSS